MPRSAATRRAPHLLALMALAAALLTTAPAHAGGDDVVPGYDCPQHTWKWKGAPCSR